MTSKIKRTDLGNFSLKALVIGSMAFAVCIFIATSFLQDFQRYIFLSFVSVPLVMLFLFLTKSVIEKIIFLESQKSKKLSRVELKTTFFIPLSFVPLVLYTALLQITFYSWIYFCFVNFGSPFVMKKDLQFFEVLGFSILSWLKMINMLFIIFVFSDWLIFLEVKKNLLGYLFFYSLSITALIVLQVFYHFALEILP